MPNPHVGDHGTVFAIVCRDQNNQVIDISDATALKILFKKPDGTTFSKTASFTTDGTDGSLQCSTTRTELDTEGKWRYQGWVEKVGWEGYTDVLKFDLDPVVLEVTP